MIATLRNRNFLLLWSGGLISLIGTWMLITALPFYLYEKTGSALATSGLLMAYLAPGILFGSAAGVFVDRWDRRRVMIGASLIQAMVIPFLLLVEINNWIWIVYVVAFIESTLNQFLSPAENALLPTLVGEEHLVSANSLNGLNDNLARIAGAALGGILLGTVGFTNVAIIDAITYLIAAVFITMVVAPVVTSTETAEEPVQVEGLAKFVQELRAGLQLVAESPLLRGLFIIIGISLFGDAILSSLLPVFVQDVAGFDAAQYGWILTARGVGGVLGGLIIAQVGSRFSYTQLITGGLFFTGVLILLMVLFPTLPVILPLMIIAGPALMAWIISGQTVLQQGTEDKFRGRVFGTYGTVSTLLMFVGSGLAGTTADIVGVQFLIIAAAGFYILGGLLGIGLLAKPIAQLVPAVNSLGEQPM